MSRTDNVKKNLLYNMIKYATNLILQFALRTVLIYVMGVEYLGINGLFTNIFAFLNLAELGIGSAIVFSMYKPIADNDIEKVKSLQALYRKFYRIISLIVLIVGIGILPFLKYLIKGDLTIDINIYILYVMYLVSTLVGYFAAHKRSLLFAHQRNDVENKIKTICIFVMYTLQIVVLLLFKNYYLYLVVNIVSTILECLLIHKMANKLFPEINGKAEPIDKETKKCIVKNFSALSLYKIGGIFVSSTDSIIISMFLGAVTLGVYSNYYLIINSLISITSLVHNAIFASVGNLIASKDIDYVYPRFKQINFIFVYLSSFMTICLFVLIQPFMTVWTGGGIYLLDDWTVVAICVSFYLNRMRSGVNIFKDCAGLFWKDRWKPIVEALTNLVVSIVLVNIFGVLGVFIGTIVSLLVAAFWVEPYILYRHYFKKNVWEYFKRYLLDLIIMITGCTVIYLICIFIPNGGILWLILKFVICITLSNLILILAYFPTKEFKELWGMLKNILKKFKNKKIKRH